MPEVKDQPGSPEGPLSAGPVHRGGAGSAGAATPDGYRNGQLSGRLSGDAEQDQDIASPQLAPRVLIITGLSGAGRTTAINALEDLGYEAIENLPLPLFETLIASSNGPQAPIAIGVETRTRGFSARALTETVAALRTIWQAGAALLFLDCSDRVLLARFNQTRRRHPLAPAEDPATGILRERDILAEIREQADAVIDTSAMNPHELKAELAARFALDHSVGMAVTLQSFSYKRGSPPGADMVIDTRFLHNPYWRDDLRMFDGRDGQIQEFVRSDPLYAAFLEKLCDLITMLLPAYRDEGKAYFTLALGCTGGRHRSVSVAEEIGRILVEQGWPVSIRHRELERRAGK